MEIDWRALNKGRIEDQPNRIHSACKQHAGKERSAQSSKEITGDGMFLLNHLSTADEARYGNTGKRDERSKRQSL